MSKHKKLDHSETHPRNSLEGVVYTPLTAPNLSPQRALAEAVGGKSSAAAALPYFEAVEQCLRDAAYDHNWRQR